ncbi:TlpA family protein disulfide reductase [Halpernia sp. GG3]
MHRKRPPKKVQQVDDLEKKLNIKFNKVAVLYIGVESEWQRFITKSHLQNWFNIISSEKGKRISELIPITGTPAFFILDKNGNLLVKSFNEKILRDAVKNQKKH